MKAVILAGGQGTRLLPLTINTPKAMVPIANKPFLELFLSYLKYYGVDEAILALGHLPEAVARYFGDGSRFGIKITTSFEKVPLGTAGAVKNAAELLDGPFLVFNGDVFTDIDLKALSLLHRVKRSIATIALTEVNNPSSYGVLDLDQDGMIRRFVEKPPCGQEPSNQINAGVYLLNPEVLDWIPTGRFAMFERHVFPNMLSAGMKMYGYTSKAYWIDIGTPEKYLAVNQDIISGRVNPKWLELHSQAELDTIKCGINVSGPIRIGVGTIIGKGANLKGPLVIGRGCAIGENAFLEGVVVWDGVRIGESAFLKNCIVGRDVCIGSRCQVPDGCVVGDGIRIKDGQVLLKDDRIHPPVDIPSPQ